MTQAAITNPPTFEDGSVKALYIARIQLAWLIVSTRRRIRSAEAAMAEADALTPRDSHKWLLNAGWRDAARSTLIDLRLMSKAMAQNLDKSR